MRHSLLCFLPADFCRLELVMHIGLIHYRGDWHHDFCHTLPQAWVNYKAGNKCPSYSWGDHDQMKSNKSDDYLFDKRKISL